MPASDKLRARRVGEPLHVVLVEPEIPPNTGAVARTCAATESRLHLVGKLGFEITEQRVRRAGLDYWPLVDLHRHDSFDAFLEQSGSPRLHLFTTRATRSYIDADFQPGDALVFGKESVGLSEELLSRYPDRWVGIPTIGGVRSLNLSNAVAISVFEALRATGSLATTFVERAGD